MFEKSEFRSGTGRGKGWTNQNLEVVQEQVNVYVLLTQARERMAKMR